MSEDMWIQRAQSAEASLTTCRDQTDRVNRKYRSVMETLGAKERSDGTIDIDFEVLVKRLSTEHALELRSVIDQHHRISGVAGEKPRISIRA